MNDPTQRKSPPDSEDDWAFLWDGIGKAQKSWLIVGPIHAVISNWKALAAAVALIVWFNRPEIAAALTVIFGGAE